MTLCLPYPPSVNHYWRVWKGRKIVSREGREYRKAVWSTVLRQMGNEPKPIGGLLVTITMYPPDRRRRDVDNILKPLLDALQDAAVFDDDYQVECLHVRRTLPVEHGRVDVTIMEADKWMMKLSRR